MGLVDEKEASRLMTKGEYRITEVTPSVIQDAML
jgi:hypothetical protein